MSFTKPANLIATVAYNTIQAAAADITFSAGKISFNGIGAEKIKLDAIVGATKTAFSAGVKQKDTLDFAGVTVTSGNPYTMSLRRLDTDDIVTFQVIARDNLTTTLASDFRTAILNDLGAFVTVGALVGSAFFVQEVDPSVGGFISTVPSGATVAFTTAHVSSSGTLTEVQVYAPLATAGSFAKYAITYNRAVNNSIYDKNFVEMQIIVWADQGAANFAAFDSELNPAGATSILSGAFLDGTNAGTLKTTVAPYVAVA